MRAVALAALTLASACGGGAGSNGTGDAWTILRPRRGVRGRLASVTPGYASSSSAIAS